MSKLIVTRAITLTQPWATLMAIGAKKNETRGWSTSYRGWLAIHAAKAYPQDCQLLRYQEPFATALRNHGLLPRGYVLAVVNLTDCVKTDGALGQVPEPEFSFGDYSDGRYAFITNGCGQLREPIEMRGMLSIWKMPRSITEADLR